MAPDASWTFTPGVVLILLVALGLYVARWRAARREATSHPPGLARLALFGAGIALVAGALLSPVDRLGEQLLVMHMVQHVLLLDVAPVLLILGLSKVLLRPVTRRLTALERRAGLLSHPGFAIAFYVAAMWGWHVPALYDAAARHSLVHVLEHLSFAGAGALYWWHLLSPIRSRLRLGGMGPLAYMAGTKVLVGLLGIALAFAPHALYGFYETQGRFWGLSPTDDQSLAGLVMALEQSLVMGIAVAVLFARMLAESEREEQRAERYGAA